MKFLIKGFHHHYDYLDFLSKFSQEFLLIEDLAEFREKDISVSVVRKPFSLISGFHPLERFREEGLLFRVGDVVNFDWVASIAKRFNLEIRRIRKGKEEREFVDLGFEKTFEILVNNFPAFQFYQERSNNGITRKIRVFSQVPLDLGVEFEVQFERTGEEYDLEVEVV